MALECSMSDCPDFNTNPSVCPFEHWCSGLPVDMEYMCPWSIDPESHLAATASPEAQCHNPSAAGAQVCLSCVQRALQITSFVTLGNLSD